MRVRAQATEELSRASFEIDGFCAGALYFEKIVGINRMRLNNDLCNNRYEAPKLTVYGSVKHQTHGAVSRTNDSGGSQSGNPPQGSDRRLKQDIVQVGRHPQGFGLYLFDYKPEFRELHGHGRQFGVMADEVEQVVPEAVVVAEDGYQRVDYSHLGIARY